LYRTRNQRPRRVRIRSLLAALVGVELGRDDRPARLPVASIDPLRDRLAHLTTVAEPPPQCPPDWGALELAPSAVEFWEESPDRLHERRLYLRDGDGWTSRLLAP
jgi:pyridoxine/pyridoxamine 5'-phosphate oxidase